jgi:nucleotide-binding universal stress UspA family protein
MERYQTIVASIAFDDRDATTLRYVAHFSKAARSKVVYLAHVAPTFDLPPGVLQLPEVALPIDEEIEQRLQQACAEQQVEFPPYTRIEYVARQGSIIPELVRLAAQKSADLVCIGRLPYEEHDPLSDSAVKMLRMASCSTFLIPAGVEPRYDRILVPVDFSEHSREALDVAVAIATSNPGAMITVLHVYGVPAGYYKAGRTYEEFAYIMRSNAEREWEEFSRTINFRSLPWNMRFELSEKVAKTVLGVADEINAQLIVMASHGRTYMAGVLLGHVADSVSLRANRPLLCVKKKGEAVNFLHALLQLLDLE